MSYTSLYTQVTDQPLMNRLTSAVEKEAFNNADLTDTEYGRAIKNGQASPLQQFAWPLAVATEAAYEYAINAGNPSPGGDPSVITDEDILASVQTNWPAQWPPPSPTAAPTT